MALRLQQGPAPERHRQHPPMAPLNGSPAPPLAEALDTGDSRSDSPRNGERFTLLLYELTARSVLGVLIVTRVEHELVLAVFFVEPNLQNRLPVAYQDYQRSPVYRAIARWPARPRFRQSFQHRCRTAPRAVSRRAVCPGRAPRTPPLSTSVQPLGAGRGEGGSTVAARSRSSR